ncbi:DUF1796 family putative cysteine peptidase [Methylobacterium oryzae]|uniref:Papain-like cysteine peptidase n=1 Tax=Methylobacterium oryzae TaxID=334852 RepID=A0ABU7TMQ8_9HYPH
MTFEVRNIVSLGAWCQATFQVRRIFGASASSPYDWLVTPFDALISSINDEGRNFGQAVYVRDNDFPMCHNYDLLYHHEFHRHAGRPIITEHALASLKSKLTHKYNQFANVMNEGGALLVRMGGHAEPAVAWPYITDPKPFSSADVNRLTSTLDSKFASREYRILVVNLEGRVAVNIDDPIDERVIFRTIPFATERPRWEGNDEAWDNIFKELPFSFKMTDHNSELDLPREPTESR